MIDIKHRQKSHLIFRSTLEGGIYSQECKDGPQLQASVEAGEDCTWGSPPPPALEGGIHSTRSACDL